MPLFFHFAALQEPQTGAPSPLDPGRFWRNSAAGIVLKGIKSGRFGRQSSSGPRRSGMGDIRRRHRCRRFRGLLLFTWYFAATLFLIFAGNAARCRAQRHDQYARPRRPAGRIRCG
jgi:hypothetical protein